MYKYLYLFLSLFILGCSGSSEPVNEDVLEVYLNENVLDTQTDVIACAATSKATAEITSVFFYPPVGATDFRYFEMGSHTADQNNLANYMRVEFPIEPVFNGYLMRFVRKSTSEAWGIVTFEIDGKIRTSNPIRLKNITFPTEWTSNVAIDQTDATAPKFSWGDGTHLPNEIYFQVVSNSTNDLLSGTYTYDKWFQYYKLDNVVLNVTRDTPPALMLNKTYNFTMMGVSIDNWVNLVLEKQFEIQ